MIAMQYGFTLPADYDMTIIDRRMRDKGPLLDGYPDLRFKAYLAARRKEGDPLERENLYAPFYLWDAPSGIDRFLSGPGFSAVTRDFGWPVVRTWVVWHAEIGADVTQASHADRLISPIAPHADLDALRREADAETEAAMRAGALAVVTGFDPTGWTRMRFRLWSSPPPSASDAGQSYTVGHVSPGEGHC